LSTLLQTDPAPWWNEGAFLYMGRLGANKGVREILAAWLMLRRRLGATCPDLWLAGGSPTEISDIRDDPSYSPLLGACERMGRVRWWGYLDEPGISALLLKTRALIMHSAYEPGGRVILEAVAAGVPVIATPHGFACDLVKDWVSGFLVPHGDVDLLARRMEHFARQPLLTPSLGFAARSTARAALNNWAFFQTHGRVYQDLPTLAEPGPRAGNAVAPDYITDPAPLGLVGRYPFSAALPEADTALEVAARLLDVPPEECSIRAREPTAGALEWELVRGPGRWSIRHFYSTYSDRPLWDRGSIGPHFEPGIERRRRAGQAASLPGFSTVVLDPHGDFLVEEAVRPTDNKPADEGWREVALHPLRKLWKAKANAEEARHLRDRVDRWWQCRDQRPWQGDPLTAASLRRRTLRVALPELRDKLSRGDINVGATIARRFAAATSGLETLAALEQELEQLAIQFGDCRPGILGIANGQYYLTAAPTVELAWWGRDAAQLLMRPLDLMSRGANSWETDLAQVCPDPVVRPIVKAWLAIEATEAVARARAFSTERSDFEARVEHLLTRLPDVSP
jgi:hypothetical protein